MLCQASSSCKSRRRASQGAERTWVTLGHRKAPRVTFGARVFLHRYLANLACGTASDSKSFLALSLIVLLVPLQCFLALLEDVRPPCRSTSTGVTPRSLSVSQRRSAPCDALRRGLQLDYAWFREEPFSVRLQPSSTLSVITNSFLMKFIVKW